MSANNRLTTRTEVAPTQTEDDRTTIPGRRRFLAAAVSTSFVSAASAKLVRHEMPWQEGSAAEPQTATTSSAETYVFLTAAEAAFLSAAVARLIPADDLGPGALEAGAVVFIDRQLAGDYGRGERWYMQGPWGEGEATQGYQTRHTPASLYRAAIREIDQAVSDTHRVSGFAQLAPTDQDLWLEKLENGNVTLQTVAPKTFFQLLLQNTHEGFWCDPIYGGNRDMVGWKLIGFPGARYDQTAFVGRHGERYPLPPVGLTGRPEWIKEKA